MATLRTTIDRSTYIEKFQWHYWKVLRNVHVHASKVNRCHFQNTQSDTSHELSCYLFTSPYKDGASCKTHKMCMLSIWCFCVRIIIQSPQLILSMNAVLWQGWYPLLRLVHTTVSDSSTHTQAPMYRVKDIGVELMSCTQSNDYFSVTESKYRSLLHHVH